MVAVSSLGFSISEQYASNTYADGTTNQSGSLQAGVTVGTDDGSQYGSAIVLDVKKAPTSKKISAGLQAVNTLTQVANYARTQAPKDAAASRLAQAIQQLRALNLVGGGIHAVQQAARIAQEIAGAVRDLAQAEQAIAAAGGPVSSSDAASAGAAAAAAASAAALAGGGSSAPAAPSGAGAAAATSAGSTANPNAKETPAAIEAGYSNEVGSDLTGLVAGEAGLGSGPSADAEVSSSLAQTIIAQLQSTGLPVDGASLLKALQDLITDPVAGAQELQQSAKAAGLNVTVTTSLDVKSTLADPRSAAAGGVSPGAAAAAIDDPYDELIRDAVAALSAIGKGLRKALPPLLNSPNRKIADEARRAQEKYGKAVADTVVSVDDYYRAKGQIEAEGGSDGTPSPATKAQIDAADAVINGSDADNDQGGTTGDDAGISDADTALGAGTSESGAPAIDAGSVAGTSISLQVSVNIEV